MMADSTGIVITPFSQDMDRNVCFLKPYRKIFTTTWDFNTLSCWCDIPEIAVAQKLKAMTHRLSYCNHGRAWVFGVGTFWLIASCIGLRLPVIQATLHSLMNVGKDSKRPCAPTSADPYHFLIIIPPWDISKSASDERQILRLGWNDKAWGIGGYVLGFIYAVISVCSSSNTLMRGWHSTSLI